MKNEFKSFFELDKGIEVRKIVNDHMHIREMKFNKLVIYTVISCVGYVIIRLAYNIYTNGDNYKYNLLFRTQQRCKNLKMHYHYIRSSDRSFVYSYFNEQILRFDIEKSDDKSIKFILTNFHNNLLFINHLRRRNIDNYNVKEYNRKLLKCLDSITKRYKEKYIYRIIELLDLDVRLFELDNEDVRIVSNIMKELDYHPESIRFLYYFENSVYYKVKRIIKSLNNVTLDELKYVVY
jgi:hypothetical protein